MSALPGEIRRAALAAAAAAATPSPPPPAPHPAPRSKDLPAAFRTEVLNARGRDAAAAPPVRLLGGASALSLRAADVYLLAATRGNANAMMILSFLSRLVELVRAYAGGDFSEEVVKGNFLLVLELLEDALDWGYPQVCVGGTGLCCGFACSSGL